jgi:transcriptional antiterminator RfaH
MWSVAQLRPNQTHIATRNLKRQRYNSFNPCFETRKLYRNKLVIVHEPVFPGYLFVEIVDGQRWVPIDSTNASLS